MLSIIIVSFNTKKVLRDCLESIIKSSRIMPEIIVVDNASTDGSVEMLENEFADSVRLISNDHNLGFGAANNIGSKAATGKYLLFLNSDTIIHRDPIGILKALQEDANIGLVAPLLLLPDGSPQPFAFGRLPKTLMGYITAKFFPRDHATGKEIFETDWVSGAAMAIDRELFVNSGGFDEEFFMYFEDMDLCCRVRQAGHRVAVDPRETVTHLVAQSSLGLFKKRKTNYYRSQDLFFSKYHSSIELFLLRIIRLPLKLVANLKK